MLQRLRIQDFILVEQVEVPFSKGLNVVTGETGSGKSVLLKALRLLSGARADSSLIRKGSDECMVEGLFSLPPSSPIFDLLQEEGVTISTPSLSLKRTISKEGKSCAYIQGICCKSSLLKTIAPFLFEIVDQHASLALFSEEKQLASIDQYAKLLPTISTYKEHYLSLQRLTKKRELLLSHSHELQAKLYWYKEQEKELSEAALSISEENTLESEYKILSHAQELSQGALKISGILSGDDSGILHPLKQALRELHSLASLDPKLQEDFATLSSASLELQELSHTLEGYARKVEIDPYRMQEVAERLDVYAKLQKKYGKTTDGLLLYLDSLFEQIEAIDFSDENLEELEKEIKNAQQTVALLADTLTEKRGAAAKNFCQELELLLHSLEMPYAQLDFSMEKRALSSSGQDTLSIELKANLGELFAPLASSASGGEMARVTLAVKRILSSTTSQSLMVFDEIDAGIGGKTASTVADQLHKIAQNHQILLITHFPQVAKRADHHIKMFKQTQNARTFTLVEVLDETTQKQELHRMVGEEVLV